jgi:hypothetical protein
MFERVLSLIQRMYGLTSICYYDADKFFNSLLFFLLSNCMSFHDMLHVEMKKKKEKRPSELMNVNNLHHDEKDDTIDCIKSFV